MRNLEPAQQKWTRRRLGVLASLLFLFAFGVTKRAYDLQVRGAAVLRREAEAQYRNTIRLSPMRGTIYDRDGAELAVSVQVDSVFANPRDVQRGGRSPAEVARLLATAIPGLDVGRIEARLASGKRFVWIARRVTPGQAARVRDLRLEGVALTKEARRFYPNRELAAHVLGFANVDGVGIEGLELSFEERLRGSNRVVPAITDRRGRVVFSEQLFDDSGNQGDDLYLTIDKTIQAVAEHELAMAVQTFEARAASLVALDPRTGEILALVSYPTFNPNDPGRVDPALADRHPRLNRALVERFEPGSTVKPFTIAAALDVGTIRPEQLVDCQNGAMQVAEYVIHDSHPYQLLTPAQVLAFSSNIGTAKIASTLGRAGLFRAFRRFGFGQETGVPLPGETSGILRHYRRWYEMDAATISFGQGMSATTLQLATAMGAVANEGRLMQPILVRRIVGPDGETVEQALPTARRQVVRADTARLVADMLTAVTGPGGTGEEAAIDGYLVAGKTGTAQKANYVGGGYAEDRWISSFVGFVPARNPRLVIAVVVDEPMIAHYGGEVAGPVFRRVGEAALRHLGVPASGGGQALAEHQRREREREREVRRMQREARRVARAAGSPTSEAPPQVITPTGEAEHEVRVPNLVGRTARAAVVELVRVDLVPELEGSGVVVGQEPAPFAIVPSGTRVRVVLRRPDLPAPVQANETEATERSAPLAVNSTSRPEVRR